MDSIVKTVIELERKARDLDLILGVVAKELERAGYRLADKGKYYAIEYPNETEWVETRWIDITDVKTESFVTIADMMCQALELLYAFAAAKDDK